MEYLVGVGVADPAEEVRIRERALQRVVLARERGAECVEVTIERLDAAAIVRVEARAPLHDVQRRALLRPGFREEERSVLEVEGGEAAARGRLGGARKPVTETREHEVW